MMDCLGMAIDRKNDILYIQEWMKKEPQLPDPFDDEITLKFLHCTYYSMELTKQCINRFCTLRHSMPQIFLQRDPMSPNLQVTNCFDDTAYAICGDMVVFFFKLGEDVNKFNLYDTAKIVSVKFDYWIKTEHYLPEGHAAVLDLKNINIKHLSKLNLALLKDYLRYLLESMPVRVKKIFIVNAPPVTDMFFNLVKPILSAEIIEIISISPDTKKLQKCIDKKYLPSDYGGDNKSVNELSKDIHQQVNEHRKMFLDDDLWKGDASKIPKKADDNIMNGSFRTLSID